MAHGSNGLYTARVGSERGSYRHGWVAVWDTTTGNLAHWQDGGIDFAAVAFSPDGKAMAAGGGGHHGTLVVWAAPKP